MGETVVELSTWTSNSQRAKALSASSLLSLVLGNAATHTENLLLSVLLLLDLLSRPLALLLQTDPCEPVLRFEFLGVFDGVIYQREAR